jgi:hypothetical protein
MRGEPCCALQGVCRPRWLGWGHLRESSTCMPPALCGVVCRGHRHVLPVLRGAAFCGSLASSCGWALAAAGGVGLQHPCGGAAGEQRVGRDDICVAHKPGPPDAVASDPCMCLVLSQLRAVLCVSFLRSPALGLTFCRLNKGFWSRSFGGLVGEQAACRLPAHAFF